MLEETRAVLPGVTQCMCSTFFPIRSLQYVFQAPLFPLHQIRRIKISADTEAEIGASLTINLEGLGEQLQTQKVAVWQL